MDRGGLRGLPGAVPAGDRLLRRRGGGPRHRLQRHADHQRERGGPGSSGLHHRYREPGGGARAPEGRQRPHAGPVRPRAQAGTEAGTRAGGDRGGLRPGGGGDRPHHAGDGPRAGDGRAPPAGGGALEGRGAGRLLHGPAGLQPHPGGLADP